MSFNRAKFKNKPKQDEPKRKQTKAVQDGITFDSPLELYTYNLLKENNIEFELKKKYQLMESLMYGGKLVMGISLTVDFYLPQFDIILDPKGHIQGATDVKWKLLKRHLYDLGLDPRICFVYSQKSAREFITQLYGGFKEDVDKRFINGRIKRLKKVFKLVGDTFYYPSGLVALSVSDLSVMPDYDLYKLIKKNTPL